MNKPKLEAIEISRSISKFLSDYAPFHLTTSKHTLKSYETSLSLFIGYLETVKQIRPCNFDKRCFERIMIEDWLVWLVTEHKCCPETCNNRLAAIRAFLKYLGTRDIRFLYLSNEASGIPLRKTQKRKVNGISRDAIKSLLASPNPETNSGLRDLVFMLFLYATAVRLDEALSLKINQLHLDAAKPYVTVIGKGGKIRTLDLLPKAVGHMKRYLKRYHGDNPDGEAYVFYSRNTGPNGKLTQAAIAKMLKKHAAKTHETHPDVPLALHAHQFRHAKASHWLEDGMNIVQISFLLGHAQLQTTMVYLDVTTEQEAKALATLEDENDKNVHAKWKNSGNTLADLCGVKPMKK